MQVEVRQLWLGLAMLCTANSYLRNAARAATRWTSDREGPRLGGVYGRKAGSVPGFDYSDGLKNSGMTWSDATLEKWLSGPDTVVPDAKMDFYVPKAQERQDLIAYFKR
jgi:cytochrome c2